MPFVCVALVSCAGCADSYGPKLPPGEIMFLGDSLVAGVQSWTLNEHTQSASLAVLFTEQLRQAGVVDSTFELKQPLLRDDINRVDVDVVADNIAVPGVTTEDLVREAAGPLPMTLTDLLLWPAQGTQVDVARQRRPKIVLLWVGSNDAVPTVIHPPYDLRNLTDVDSFRESYHSAIERLAEVHAKLVVGNIFDVTAIPALVPASTLGGDDNDRIYFGDALAVRAGLKSAAEVLDDPARVLDATELATIRERVEAFNAVIAEEAARYGAALVDVATALAELQSTLPPDLEQAAFSFDGVHPSPTGYALITDIFIAAFNEAYGTEVEAVDVAKVAASDDYFDHDGDGFVAGPSFPLTYSGAADLLALIPRDCSPFDPSSAPGMVDPPGDGVDQNCDGVDGQRQ